MNKTARLKLCNRLSPRRFEKTAAPLQQLLSNLTNKVKGGWSRYSKYLDTLGSKYDFPKDVPSQGFWEGLWNGATAYLNPQKYVEAVKYGPHMFIKNLRDTTFNPTEWKNNALGNTINTAFNLWGPYATLSILFDSSPYNDTEGTVQKTTRNAMNIADAIDLSSRVMNKGVFGIPAIIGNIATRGFIAPMITSKIDKALGTEATKEQLTNKLIDRVNKGANNIIKENPEINTQEARMQALQNTLSIYGPEAAQKIFS